MQSHLRVKSQISRCEWLGLTRLLVSALALCAAVVTETFVFSATYLGWITCVLSHAAAAAIAAGAGKSIARAHPQTKIAEKEALKIGGFGAPSTLALGELPPPVGHMAHASRGGTLRPAEQPLSPHRHALYTRLRGRRKQGLVRDLP